MNPIPVNTTMMVFAKTGRKYATVADSKNVIHAVNNGLLENTFILLCSFYFFDKSTYLHFLSFVLLGKYAQLTNCLSFTPTFFLVLIQQEYQAHFLMLF